MMFRSRIFRVGVSHGTRYAAFRGRASLPADRRGWQITFGDLTGAVRWIENFIWAQHPLDESAVRGLNYNLPACRDALDACDIDTLRRSIPEVVEFAGGHWQSWHECLVGIAQRQRSFLERFLPPGHDDEVTAERADANVSAVVSGATTDGWPWDQPLDIDKLWSMIEWEITKLPKAWPATSTRERNDDPTDAEIERGREVLGQMTAKNPGVEAFRTAARNYGLKGSNKKLGRIFRAAKR